MVPRPGERPADNAVTGIVLMNVAIIIGALVSGDGLAMMMWPYWIQSMVIGFYNVRRIQKLQRFSTDGLKINGRSVEPTPATRRETWVFFTIHYGFFHFGYLMFLLAYSSGILTGTGVDGEMPLPTSTLGVADRIWFAVTAVGFLVSHGQSHREHVDADLSGTPNIGTLMFIPYIRIIPMHLTIIVGALLGNGLGILLFGGLKTVADVVMHKVEHRMLQRSASAVASR
jgi:hypothetical protein